MFHTSTWYEHTDSYPELRAISKLNSIEMHVGHLELDSHVDNYTTGKNSRNPIYTHTICLKKQAVTLPKIVTLYPVSRTPKPQPKNIITRNRHKQLRKKSMNIYVRTPPRNQQLKAIANNLNKCRQRRTT